MALVYVLTLNFHCLRNLGVFYPFFILRTDAQPLRVAWFPVEQGNAWARINARPASRNSEYYVMGFIGYDGQQNAPKNAWGLRQQLLLRKFKNEKWDENNGQSRDHSILTYYCKNISSKKWQFLTKRTSWFRLIKITTKKITYLFWFQSSS